MTSEEAYSILCKHFENETNIVLVSGEYDSVNFGNFAIQIEISGNDKLIICDRNHLSICNDLTGIDDCCTIVPSIRDVSAEDLLIMLDLS